MNFILNFIIENKVMENSFGLIIDFIKVNGWMENNMAREFIKDQMELKKKVNGEMEKKLKLVMMKIFEIIKILELVFF